MLNHPLLWNQAQDLMLSIFNFIVWDQDPIFWAFKIGDFEWAIRWYGVFFATPFIISYYLLNRIFQIEGKPETYLESLFIYIFVAVIIGARLGHCIFYDPHYYFIEAPEKLFAIWEGGLASHGATIGIFIAVWLFVLKQKDKSFLWVADRLVIVIALVACSVRLGNFFNSEICGVFTELPWAIEFIRGGDDCSGGPRHPTQLYEAISYIIIFFWLHTYYYKKKQATPEGSIAGLFLISLFTARFIIEFSKVNQEAYQNPLPINTGQMLSLPFIAIGIYFFMQSKKAPTTQNVLNEKSV